MRFEWDPAKRVSIPTKDLTARALLREMSDEEVDARASDDPDTQPTDATM
ncbi:MAG: hypothetical protein GY719_05585 [bacterium]|nr:hypothetical protein [bacterium]